MSSSVRVNTFLQENDQIYIDPISKVFIISEAAFGYFRLPMIRNRKLLYYLLAVPYALFLNGILFSVLYLWRSRGTNIVQLLHTFQYTFSSVCSFVCIKRLRLFYMTLNKFDVEVGCRPKCSRYCIQNLAQTILTIILYCLLFVVSVLLGVVDKDIYILLIIHISYTLELYFYGHLLNILVPRLRLINYYIESSLSNVTCPSSIMDVFLSLKTSARGDMGHLSMKKLMDLYHVIVEAYDFLIDAIKWQLLISIIGSFVSILGFLYAFSLSFIKGSQNILRGILMQLTLSALIMVPLFAPCTFGDKVHYEVKRLRELLSSKLYENKLDKSGRSIARALLAFTETRDLAFRLLRMLNIDISLPFKFMGLLITYLIILLQFEKVIHPTPTDIAVLNGTAK